MKSIINWLIENDNENDIVAASYGSLVGKTLVKLHLTVCGRDYEGFSTVGFKKTM